MTPKYSLHLHMGGTAWALTFLFLLFHMLTPEEAALTVGAGVGVGIGIGGGGGGGVIIGGGGVTPPSGSSSSSLIDAYKALQAWKSAIADDPLGVLATWVGSDVCSYRGVFCAADPEEDMGSAYKGSVVAGVDLNRANLQGTLVKDLSLLTDMTLLHLSGNRFSGAVPDTFRGLSSLQELDLSNNHFSGPFPQSTLLIPNLIYLDLRFNSFSGPIPEDLFNKHLDAILINDNNFEGKIPPTLGNSPASVINLANNRFSGNLPSSFAYMNYQVKEILFLNNQLSGCIPEGVGFLTNMEVLDVSSNNLTGQLPHSLSCLNAIEVLNVAHNQLSGVVPELVCSMRSLVNLTVSFNFFSGFSQDCAKTGVGFDFSSNCIPGRSSQRPGSDCSEVPGGSNCLRMPSIEALVCGSLVAALDKSP